MRGKPVRAFLARGHERKPRAYTLCPDCGKVRRLYPLIDAPLTCATCRRVRLWGRRIAADSDTPASDTDTRHPDQ